VSDLSDGPIAAPDFDGATEWLNVASPISIAQLRGKVVLIDFWTYGCVNCMHVLRDLKTLEARFPGELVVIGVHSPKFTNERSSDNLKRILVRYEIEHPVANDANHAIWRRYGVQAWPTRVIVDPAGNLVGTAMGEGNLEGFVSAIRGVIRVFDERGEIDPSPLPLDLERARHADRPLSYPGKVLADADGDRLYISDSSHNRIVVCTLGGALVQVVGSGIEGDADGIFTQARFSRPQGVAIDGATLYVADTGNDQVRAVDFATRAVHTVEVSNLKSPWDLALTTGILIVAMAGPHQIWVIDLLHDRAYPYAGTGEEARRDGAVNEAAFAQPSGLALDPSTSPGAGGVLYVADAESNTIREVMLPPANTVRTVAGGDLFEFGDADGTGNAVRLQHPLGVAVHGGRVFIADTYNHKIKMLDPRSGRVETVAGTGSPGFADGVGTRAQFHEPGGLSIAGDTVFVADTNNHVIRTVDTRTFAVSTLTLEGLAPPAAFSYLRPQTQPGPQR
jgi:YVTN family beta-propeller protein